MRVLHGLDGLRSLPPRCVMSIGNFDGMHIGHQRIVRALRDVARGGRPSAIVTFEPHPLTVLKPEIAPPRLTPPAIKQAMLQQAGVDHLVILPPEPSVLGLSAEDFWAILRDQVRVSHLVEGHSFNFGKGRSGTLALLRLWAAQSDVTVDVVEPVEAVLLDLSVVPVSSSIIRWLLSCGRARDAAICLGRPYILEGNVVRGFGRGRTIGLPTINLDCADQMVPMDGVYAARCDVDGTTWPAATSIGTLPTFDESQRQIEAHLAGFDGDLYGRTLRLELVDWIREQRKFTSVESLKLQIQRDIERTRRLIPRDPSRPIASTTFGVQ